MSHRTWVAIWVAAILIILWAGTQNTHGNLTIHEPRPSYPVSGK